MSYNGKVEICGVNTAKLLVLSPNETTELLKRSREGDKAARKLLIQGNLRLVLSVIQKFSNRGENADDLFQVGCIGLIKAIDNFDTSLNVRFSTYGVPMIIGEIKRYLRDNNPVRITRSIRDTAYKVIQAREALMSQDQHEPTVDMIASYLKLKREDVAEALDAIQDPVSLYEPIYSDNGDQLCGMDQLSDDQNTVDSWINRMAVDEAYHKLTDREKKIFQLRFAEGKTQMQVAAEIGISQAQVSRIEKKAIHQIKDSL